MEKNWNIYLDTPFLWFLKSISRLITPKTLWLQCTREKKTRKTWFPTPARSPRVLQLWRCVTFYSEMPQSSDSIWTWNRNTGKTKWSVLLQSWAERAESGTNRTFNPLQMWRHGVPTTTTVIVKYRSSVVTEISRYKRTGISPLHWRRLKFNESGYGVILRWKGLKSTLS